MMIINNIFKNEQEELLEKIENLPVFNCIKNFNNYLDARADSDFERRYITLLNEDIGNIGKKIISKHFEELSKEELLNELVMAHMDAPYSFFSYCENNEITDFFSNYGYNDADVHSIIKEYMVDTYNKLVESITQSADKERRKAIEESIERSEKLIAEYQKDLEKYRDELVQLDKE